MNFYSGDPLDSCAESGRTLRGKEEEIIERMKGREGERGERGKKEGKIGD